MTNKYTVGFNNRINAIKFCDKHFAEKNWDKNKLTENSGGIWFINNNLEFRTQSELLHWLFIFVSRFNFKNIFYTILDKNKDWVKDIN